MKLLVSVLAAAVAAVSFAQAQPQQIDPNALPQRERPLGQAPQIDPDLLTPRCRPVEPEDPVCPGDDAEDYVILVNRLACSGECDLGDIEIRFENEAGTDFRAAAGPRFERNATVSVLKGFRFSGAGVFLEILFADAGYVMRWPIRVDLSPLGAPQLGAVIVTFPSGRVATISWDYTIYRAEP